MYLGDDLVDSVGACAGLCVFIAVVVIMVELVSFDFNGVLYVVCVLLVMNKQVQLTSRTGEQNRENKKCPVSRCAGVMRTAERYVDTIHI